MKIVEFDLDFQPNTNKVSYPDDVSLFRNTKIVGNKVIGEYYGSEPLTEYTGQWPILPKRKVLTKREFMSAFTPAEFRAIKDACATDDAVCQFWDIATVADSIDLEFQQTIDGMVYLVSQSIITQARCDEIMEGL